MPLAQRNLERSGRAADWAEGRFYFTIDRVEDLERKWPQILESKPDFIKVMLQYSEEYGQRNGNPLFTDWSGMNPEIVPLVKRVIYMGGAIDVPGNSTPAAEFNWWFDPEATRISLRAPFREQIVVPLDITERVYYTKSEYDRIVAGPETPITALYRKLHGPRFEKDPSARSFVWDALTAAIFLQPTIATSMVDRFVDIDVTYGELGSWVVGNALSVAGPVRERYLVGPRDTDDRDAWRTEIGWPVFRVATSPGIV